MKTVMIVDNENEIFERVKTRLENDNIQVETAKDSRQALEKMSGDAEGDYGLILIDTPLPGTQRSALFSMKPKSKMNTDVSNSEDFLSKPFTEEQLVNFVKSKLQK